MGDERTQNGLNSSLIVIKYVEVQEEAVRSAPGRFFKGTEILLCCLLGWDLIFELELCPGLDWLKMSDQTDCMFGISKIPGDWRTSNRTNVLIKYHTRSMVMDMSRHVVIISFL